MISIFWKYRCALNAHRKLAMRSSGWCRMASQHPENVWGLTGYHASLRRLGKAEQANFIGQRLDLVLAPARTDVTVKSSYSG